MTKEEIIEGNKLIAEFMYPEAKKEYEMGEIDISDGIYKKMCLVMNDFNHMSYHTSWDWLMPVVEKIENLGYIVKISTKCCSISKDNNNDSTFCMAKFGRNKLENIYMCIVAFTKYNKHD
jgi:hypothetical protein